MQSQTSLTTNIDDNGYELSAHAALIASGRIAIPTDLPPDRLQPLLDEVHRLRRQRLVQFLALAIAKNLATEHMEK
ncbi:hypothetical protein Q31b_57970 [Novipirellula aureliae]|uniref:Uncharacterized protein n=1 Tax=Novipirellula aureliae TaxID=2527966 RepID=A0A5C6DAP2_9BACT|nr:hypothetical protein [Novipirellula aureliae]TWU32787.1 hypothetical protein Q31b_57970 [Novipirellula aureliae]